MKYTDEGSEGSSGLTYYVNSVSGVSQWEPPTWLTEIDPTTGY